MAIAILSFVRNFVRNFLGIRAQAAEHAQSVQPSAQHPARTVRVVHKGPGRMVISGRFADVCAELDRLAALESRGAQPAFAPTR